ncbi:MAG: cysteine synthase A [Clostridia bacterium]|nr:cysteine synthase A [Clostridia bacterium]
MSKIFESIDELIGKTPLLRLKKLEVKYNLQCRLYAKVELFNPTGSIKARAALEMINAAEKSGELRPGGTIIEPTSGNTGIAIAAIAASRGYSSIIVMPDSMSRERRILMAAYGAEVVLTPAALGMKGSIDRANELKSEIPNSFIPSQFDNVNNKISHIKSTGPEIVSDLGKCPDIFIATVGTGGTLSGIGEYLKGISKNTKVIAVEPDGSPLLSGGNAAPHKIQGIGANFIPKVLNTDIYDEVIRVTDADAYKMTKESGATLGLGIGISSGAALSALLTVARRESSQGLDIVTVFPDGIDRYLSTDLFD